MMLIHNMSNTQPVNEEENDKNLLLNASTKFEQSILSTKRKIR